MIHQKINIISVFIYILTQNFKQLNFRSQLIFFKPLFYFNVSFFSYNQFLFFNLQNKKIKILI